MAEEYETYATTDVTVNEVRGEGSETTLPTEALASADNLYNVLRRYIRIGFWVAPPLRVGSGWYGGRFPKHDGNLKRCDEELQESVAPIFFTSNLDRGRYLRNGGG